MALDPAQLRRLRELCAEALGDAPVVGDELRMQRAGVTRQADLVIVDEETKPMYSRGHQRPPEGFVTVRYRRCARFISVAFIQDERDKLAEAMRELTEYGDNFGGVGRFALKDVDHG